MKVGLAVGAGLVVLAAAALTAVALAGAPGAATAGRRARPQGWGQGREMRQVP